MPVSILMPALSPTMSEGNLARWLKAEGDVVKAGQVIAEIETDKATMEVEAVDEGRLAKILIPAGSQGIKVNTPIAVLAEEGEDLAAAASATPTASPAALSSPSSPAFTPVTGGSAMLSSSQVSPQSSRVAASPLAKRVAAMMGVELSDIKGSGPHGRIIKADVEAAAKTKTAAPAGAAMSSGAGAPRGAAASTPAMNVRDFADKLGMTYQAVPNSAVRKVIAQRLQQSKQTVPHFYLTIDCTIDELLDLRKKMNALEGVKISVNDFIIRASALALKQVPAANTSWTDDAILHYAQADVAVAVATPNGLMTPIIKAAETKTVAQLSAEMKTLAAKARDNKLRPEEFQGGGFTISNLGMFGIKEFSAIINPPQSCILAVGGGEQRPVVRDGKIEIATQMTVTLSVDHRAVDGAVGAEFLAAFKKLIEQPYQLIV
ncbi:MAG: pyruvate dehydrogenase complex dihydrolipoamide acetyltransferase [Alphaproteobacteria bacterium]|nr:pyruvate dehydrogenase complex dihydrolipoamide acetyltransferase [Alphaproteobacteria bacterium]